MRFFGPKDIERHTERYIAENAASFRGRSVVDIPAGAGAQSRLFAAAGARVEAFDLLPERFAVPGLTCRAANLSERLPIESAHADVVWCSEAMEHLPNHVQAFREFGRILKLGGTLLITTRNYSSLRSRLSYLVMESEQCFGALMPPNEVDSVWYADDAHADVYFGHMFLVGIQRLRAMARLSGFRIRRVHHLKVNKTSLLLFPLLYPAIALISLVGYGQALRRTRRKRGRGLASLAERRAVYREQLRLNLDPRILVDQDLFIEFEKEVDAPAARGSEARREGEARSVG
jgi:SAM-dependent methyltransferase